MDIRSIIIDDELQARKNLKFLIKNFIPEVQLIGEYCNAQKALKTIIEKQPNLLFLDIHMPEQNGFDFLEMIGERNFEVIFVTAHNKFGIEAVKAGALDYILKPISIGELRNAVNKYKKRRDERISLNNESTKDFTIKIPQAHGFQLLDSRNIIKLEAENNYTRLFINDKREFFISKTIKEFESVLDRDLFIRVHKSTIINLKYIKEFNNLDGGSLLLDDNSKIIVSRRRLPDLKNAISKKI